MSENDKEHPAVWLVPAALLVVAIFPWPYGYYVLLRICICGATAFLAYRQWSRRGRFDGWVVVLGVVAVLYNPLIPVHLTKMLWTFINLGTAGLLLGHLWWTRR